MEASHRIKGIVLHDILSRVRVLEDLEDSVQGAVLSGQLSQEQASDALVLLTGRIRSVADRGWFSPQSDRVLNETALIDTDGQVYRPDHVVISAGKVHVVDYKFGDHNSRYEIQLKKYADIWRRMGYEHVTASIWYVLTGDIIDLT